MTHRFLLGFIIASACLPGCFPEFGEYTSILGDGGGSTSSIGGSGTGGEVASTGGAGGTGGSTVSTSSSGSGGAGGGCPGSEELCNSSCTDTQTDILHCGACGNACLNTTQVSCVAGECSGPCGIVPQIGYTFCFHGLAFDPGTEGAEHVGLAGAIVPPGGDIVQLFADPMCTGSGAPTCGTVTGLAVNASDITAQNYVMLDVGMPAPNTVVFVEPGLHAGLAASTTGGIAGLACGATACVGSAILYLDGIEIGWAVAPSTTTGALTLVDHPPPNSPARKGFQFVTP